MGRRAMKVNHSETEHMYERGPSAMLRAQGVEIKKVKDLNSPFNGELLNCSVDQDTVVGELPLHSCPSVLVQQWTKPKQLNK